MLCQICMYFDIFIKKEVFVVCIGLSEKFLSFYKEIIDAQCSSLYINLLNYARIIIEIERNGSYLIQ